MKLRFRNRIALFTALAAAATIGLVFLLVYGVVYFTAYRHLDTDILKEKEEVLRSLRWTGSSIGIEHLSEWEENEHQRTEVNPTFLQLSDAIGRVLFRSSNLQNDTLFVQPRLLQAAFFNSRIDEQRLRQGQFPIRNDEGKIIGHLSVGISLEEAGAVLHNLGNTLMMTFPVLLAILFLASALAASKGIAPVQHLIRAASGIGETNIDTRLPLPENKDEIYQLATTINELLQRLEQGVQREKQFTADASHEIRTPLTAIRGTLEVLIRKRREPAQYEEKINRVMAEVDRLNRMLDQLLQLARLESGNTSVAWAQVDLAPFCQGLIEKWLTRMEEKNMEFRCQIPVATTVYTDANLLSIILDNLLGNAVKYGISGGLVECSWQAENCVLCIRDNGPGISAAHLPHVFDRFYRADASRSSAVRGSGLGLAIVKKLADLLQLALSVSSQEGQGTAFMLRFPDRF